MFQSTPPREGRLDHRLFNSQLYMVSIHAPARGATCIIMSLHTAFCQFQSTPPREGRLKARYNYTRISCFNPRPRARGDVAIPGRLTMTNCFNPRPRARGDAINLSIIFKLVGFNPRPRARGDQISVNKRRINHVSIHAPARGATELIVVYFIVYRFQSTPPREGRLFPSILLFYQSIFDGLRGPSTFPYIHIFACQRALCIFCKTTALQIPRTSRQLYVSSRFAPDHTIKLPSWSIDFFAPTCSTLRLQFDPR